MSHPSALASSVPLTGEPGPGDVVLAANAVPALADPEGALREALRRPVSGPPLSARVPAAGEVVVVLPDQARPLTPTATMLGAVLEELRVPLDGHFDRVRLLVGSGTHRPHDVPEAFRPPGMPDGISASRHVAADAASLVRFGRIPARPAMFFRFAALLLRDAARHLPSTSRDLARAALRTDALELRRLLGWGVPLRLLLAGMAAWGPYPRLNRRVTEAGLVIAIGRVKPHPFTGYSGGSKGIWPATAGRWDAGINHLLQIDPRVRPGRVRDNPLLADLEGIVAGLPNAFVANVVLNGEGLPAGWFCGDPVPAHRAACGLAREVGRVEVAPADVVVVANREQGGLDLFQFQKSLVQAGRIARPGGAVICVGTLEHGASGTGDPHTRPNFAIKEVVYHLGIRPAIARDVAFFLVAPHARAIAAGSFFRPCSSLSEALTAARERVGPAARIVRIPDVDPLLPVLPGDPEPDGDPTSAASPGAAASLADPRMPRATHRAIP